MQETFSLFARKAVDIGACLLAALACNAAGPGLSVARSYLIYSLKE